MTSTLILSRGLEQRRQNALFPLRYELLHFRRGVAVVVSMHLLNPVTTHLNGVKRFFRFLGMAQEQDQALPICHTLRITAHAVVQALALPDQILWFGWAHDLQAFAAVTDLLLTAK